MIFDRPQRTSCFAVIHDHRGHCSFLCFFFVQVQDELDISQESRKAHRGKKKKQFFFSKTCFYLQYSGTAKIQFGPLRQVLVWRKILSISSDFIRRAHVTYLRPWILNLQYFRHLAVAVFQTDLLYVLIH